VSRRLAADALLAFLLSRLLFFGLVAAGAQIEFLRKAYDNSVWETRIHFQWGRVRPEIERVSMVGDAWLYREIAEQGYDRSSRDAFFPLFPLLARALGSDFPLAGLIISNLALLIATWLLGAVAMRSGGGADDASRAMFYLAFFPTSYFLSLPVTEGLFLALSLGATLFALQGRWLGAGVAGGLATATRLAGILLIPLLLLLPATRRSAKFWIALVPCGLAAFMIHLYRVTGDALAFVHVQARFGRTFSWRALAAQLGTFAEPWNLVALNAAAALLLVVAGAHLLARREWAFGLYTLGSALLPLASGSFQSLARYAAVAFPLFLWLAARGRTPLCDRLIFATSTILFGWLTALLTLRVDLALA
jgi:Gpi18-like mannosyltransferase